MRFTKLLAFRLFAIILAVLLASAVVVTTLTVNWLAKRQMTSMVSSVSRLSDIIKRSTHYSMLLNRREDIYQIIKTVGNEPGIEAIRIYNKKGQVTFSTDTAEVGGMADLTSEACIACHGEAHPPSTLRPDELTRVFTTPQGHRVIGMITPIYNERSCSSSSCHAHSKSQTVLGVLDVILPLRDYDALYADMKNVQYATALLLVVLVSIIAGVFIWRMVNVPVRRLTRGTEEIIRGNLRHRIPVQTEDEIGVLADSFNKMSDELDRARKEIMDWTQTLERRVQGKTEELQRAQQHLIQVEKMASLGKLAATVAHELNNPLEGVLTYARLLKKRIHSQPLSPEAVTTVQNELSLIADETARCGSIVKNLLLFSREKIGEVYTEDLQSIITRTLTLTEHHLTMNQIKVEKDLGDGPLRIQCDPQQIEQALLALVINAVEAMPDGGTLRITTKPQPDTKLVVIRVQDTGFGIAQENLSHIFEPFFTTKEDGKSTGLGLSVVFGIVERHNGEIAVESTMGKGTVFTITLPLEQVGSTESPPRHSEHYAGS